VAGAETACSVYGCDRGLLIHRAWIPDAEGGWVERPELVGRLYHFLVNDAKSNELRQGKTAEGNSLDWVEVEGIAYPTAQTLAISNYVVAQRPTSVASGGAQPATVRLSIPAMMCSGCEAAVRKALTGAPGIISVDVSWQDDLAVVRYDPAKTDVSTIVGLVSNAGFAATPTAE